MHNSKKKVGLVLGSGGVRGLAHIGVIEGLEENGYEIAQISGCSMGSLIGAIYASGNLKEFKRWIEELDFWDVFGLMDFTLNSHGFIKGEKVFKEMEAFFKGTNIEDLGIPFCVVATDLKNKHEVLV
jgi:NTE family protein